MKRKTVWFIVIGVLINLLLVGGIVINSQLNRLASSWVLPADSSFSANPGDQDDAGDNHDTSSNTPGQRTKTSLHRNLVSEDELVDGVANRVGRPLEKKDIMRVGLILVRRLSWEEIDYFYEVGQKAHPSSEEIARVKTLLNGRLTDKEMQTLQDMGSKYGRDLTFLKQ